MPGQALALGPGDVLYGSDDAPAWVLAGRNPVADLRRKQACVARIERRLRAH